MLVSALQKHKSTDMVSLTLIELFILMVFIVVIYNTISNREHQTAQPYIKLAQEQTKTIKELQAALDTFESQKTAITSQKGIGNPSCLKTPQDKIQYLMTVEVGDDGLVIINSSEIPIHYWFSNQLEQWNNRLMSLSQYHRVFRPLFIESKKLQCRYYVKIYSTATTVAAHKKGMTAIEGYFYIKRVKPKPTTQPATQRGRNYVQ